MKVIVGLLVVGAVFFGLHDQTSSFSDVPAALHGHTK